MSRTVISVIIIEFVEKIKWDKAFNRVQPILEAKGHCTAGLALLYLC